MGADDAHALAEQHFATLEAGRSDALVRDLETASRFHTYSFRNPMSDRGAVPHGHPRGRLSGVAPARALGRRGETGIVILAPITRRRRDVAEEDDATEDADAVRVYVVS
jgi:hypothetical protein